jgi:hypothetical protein
VDGSFKLTNVPVGSSIPIVAVSGRWRVQGTVNTSNASCSNTVYSMDMPKNHTQGDIPLIAIATGAADQAECVLLKMGIDQSEFTDPGGGGRINFFGGGTQDKGGGVTLDGATPTQDSLMGDATTLNNYDLLMLPCEGGNYLKPAQELANLINFANAGGRVYTSHYGYAWMYQNPPFDGVASWDINQTEPDGGNSGTATVNTSFTAGQTLSTWLQNVGASTSPGQMTLSTLRQDSNGVIPPTQSWLTLNSNGAVMQFVFDTPILPAGTTGNQCGRVLFNEYHVENPSGGSVLSGTTFPNECSGGAMTPQEKLLEYMLFELTDDGGQPSLAPTAQDFGSVAISFTSPAQTFTWTNNSSFAATVSSAVANGDFNVTSTTCGGTVASGANCTITVVFTPTALGARSGTLTVNSGITTQTATLTGTGTPGFKLSGISLSFGSLDVGASASQSLTLTSLAFGPLSVPTFTTIGEYSVSTAACGSTLAAGASCAVNVSFLPTTTGPQSGTVGVNSTNPLYSGLSATLSGNGIDFSFAIDPASGTVVAGDGTSTTATATPIAGFSAPLFVSCTVASGASAAACTLSTAALVPTESVTTVASMSTTAQYTVIGYSGFGGGLWLVGLTTGWLLWVKRRNGLPVLRGGLRVRLGLLVLLLLGAMSLSLTGCTGKPPAQNVSWTAPGSYTVTVTASDGFLRHSATYSLTVTAK